MSSIHPTESSYVIDPESAAEMGRLLDQDLLINKTMGSLLPPDFDLSKVHDILDVACGPGGWAQEVAFAYPDKQVTGIDISNTMLAYARSQAQLQSLNNTRFLLMDATAPLPLPDASFDMVNARFIVGFMWKEAWPLVVAELVRITRPGGTIRLIEPDSASGITNGAAIEKSNRLAMQAFQQTGRSFYVGENATHLGITPMLGQFLQDAGCLSIREQPHILNYSYGTPGHNGYTRNLRVAFKLLQPFLVRQGIITNQEFEKVYEATVEEMANTNFRAILYFTSAYAQKPT